MKEIQDLRAYLAELDELASDLDEDQREELRCIIRTILVLLVALRKSSHLGETSVNFHF